MFTTLSRSVGLKRLASQYGMTPNGFARRFIAGETVEEAIEAARALDARGLRLTLDYLGESVNTSKAAAAATREYARLIDVIVASGIERNLSLKLTQLGLGIDRATGVDNLRRILDPAQKHEFFVRIDMENSPYTQVTIDIFETLWRLDYRNIGIALQSSLRRTDQDVRRMNELGARVRLVKGAYKEPESAAYQQKADVDAAYLRQMRLLLEDGVYPAIATHDEKIIAETREYAAERQLAPHQYEFQMLYGIRRDLQASLVAEGHRMRVYVPFGREWFPYFMRRLGERPANLGFVIRAVLGEKSGSYEPD
ncbi:MAG TPA: proline dehydrogenase family protein [Vicinamibacterales bacterium]|nr:proline dehydrogenase family protein [Vicinamibacterales bacterium]